MTSFMTSYFRATFSNTLYTERDTQTEKKSNRSLLGRLKLFCFLILFMLIDLSLRGFSPQETFLAILEKSFNYCRAFFPGNLIHKGEVTRAKEAKGGNANNHNVRWSEAVGRTEG